VSRGAATPERVVALLGAGLSAVDRDYVHRTGIFHFCAHLLCLSGETMYLQRRKKSRRRNPDRWTSTVSGHITIEDATSAGIIAADEHAGLNTLQHETVEELGRPLPIFDRAMFLGKVAAPSVGDGEVCNCTALVFTLNYDDILERVFTDEVEEIASFEISEIEAAIQDTRSLKGSDRQFHDIADNFVPVFELFSRCWRHSARVAGA